MIAYNAFTISIEGMNSMRKRKIGPVIASVLCRLLGTLILLIVIAVTSSIVIPQFRGIEVYHIVSGSMEPEIPVGSAVFVQRIQPVEIKKMDIIAYQSGDSVVIHRAMENYLVEGLISTKGDANAEMDMYQVPYDHVIGRVVRHYPKAGQLMLIYTSRIGKILLLCFAASGALFNLLSSRLRKEEAEKQMLLERDEKIREEEALMSFDEEQ